jgi:putative endopeptidase
MAATKKLKSRHTKTKKVTQFATCPTEVQPFEQEYGKTLSKKTLLMDNVKKSVSFVKQIVAKPAPKRIQPAQDFYNYVNYAWLKKKHVDESQKYIVQVDDFRLTQDKVYRDLDNIITDYIKDNKNNLSKMLTNFRTSVIEMNPIEDSKRLAKEAVKTVDDLIAGDNPWKMLAHFSKDEMIAAEAPFGFALVADDKQNTIYRCSISGHAFILLDINVYFDDGKDESYKSKYRRAYAANCNDIFDICLGKGHGLNGKDVYDVEVELFNTFACNDAVKGEEQPYNRVYAKDAMAKYGFDWEAYTAGIGFDKPPPFFITPSLNYLKCGSTLLTTRWKDPKWRTYWLFILLKRICRVTRGWEKVIFEFYGNFQRGQEGINNSDAVSSALYMSVPFNKFLTEEYIKKYKDPQVTKLALTMCEDLKVIFKRTMTRNSWLSPITKKKALHKLDKFKFVIGHYETERIDPTLDYTTNLYDNMIKIYNWRRKQLIKLEGQPYIELPMMDWMQYPVKMIGTQAYIVNASYTPTKNAIFINLGYMQSPFIDFKKGLEYNLAHLGFTIGHEMSHGFDDWGSKYDGDGNLNDWWTAEDKKKFKSIQKDVITQYEEFAARDGIEFDAAIGVGEDMADISGMGIVMEYLQDYNNYIDNAPLISRNTFNTFFVHFAYQQKQQIAKKALAAQLKTNPHPLDKYRCNIPLSRSLIFRALYDVKKGDNMWWHNTNTIW